MTHQPTALARPSTVPYIARWSGEELIAPLLAPRTVRGGNGLVGLGFADELPGDRDGFGVLWFRHTIVSTHDARGRPEFGAVHARRQRRCMTQNLCQVCGGPASVTEAGTLWLVEDEPATWPNGLETTHPPVCLPCARQAVDQCPHLLKGVHPIRVRAVRPAGVLGTFFTHSRTRLRYESESGGEVAYGSPDRFSIVAHQMVVQLSGCTPADLPA